MYPCPRNGKFTWVQHGYTLLYTLLFLSLLCNIFALYIFALNTMSNSLFLRMFEVEYWSLEQRKLKLSAKTPGVLDGQIVYISGGASGMGLASAVLFQSKGANVFVVDVLDAINPLLLAPFSLVSINL